MSLPIVVVLMLLVASAVAMATRKLRIPYTVALVITGLLGWGDEGIQYLLPGRVYELRDVGMNVTAGFLIIAAMASLRWVRSKAQAREPSGSALAE